MLLSTEKNLVTRIKQLESQGIPKKIIIDGIIFKIPDFDFKNFIQTGTVVAKMTSDNISDNTKAMHPRMYIKPNTFFSLGAGSYIVGASIEGGGSVEIGKFSQISWQEIFEVDLVVAHKYRNEGHNYHHVSNYNISDCRWNGPVPRSNKMCRVFIGNDVWIGRGCRFKCSDPDRPLVIGDGAVIASDSVVVKSVEPYTIVGGNPARFIKYRFDDPKIIEGLQRIRWWDWDIDKIYDNYKYFDDPRAFVERFDHL